MNELVWSEPTPQVTLPKALWASVIVLLLLGTVWSESPIQFVRYALVVSAAVLPTVLWLRNGARGIPVFPAAALSHIPYCALPFIGANPTLSLYSADELNRAAATVLLFLFTATAVWHFLARRHVDSRLVFEGGDAATAVRLAGAGIAIGIVYHVNAVFRVLDLGAYLGVVRSVAMTFATVGCLFAGVTRAHGTLHGRGWASLAVGIGLLIASAWSSLFLVGGIVYCLAAVFGYVIVARRVPWVGLTAILVVVAALHQGKAEMREKYWARDSNSIEVPSAASLPAFAAEWIEASARAIVNPEGGPNLVRRASILEYILVAETDTPTRVDFLYGETYAMLPAVLVPRFVNPNKPASQVAMDLLNVRYGLLTQEDAAVTARGWGLIAEGYANFGYTGVFGIALLLGAVCALLARWTDGARLVSPPMLTSIAAMMAFVNLEADFVSLFVPLFQSFAVVVLVYVVFRFVANVPSASTTFEEGAGSLQ